MKQQEKISNRLDFYKNRDETHPHNLLYEPPVEDFYGPIDTSLRTCTDWVCILIYLMFVGFTVAYTINGFILVQYICLAYSSSDADRFFHGKDFRTDLCGKQQLASKHYQYFIDPDKFNEISICVEQCPSQPDYTSQICLYFPNGIDVYEDYCYQTYFTEVYKNKYCMPKQIGPRRNSIEKLIVTDVELAKNVGGDFWGNYNIVIWAFIIQICVSVLYVAILLGKRIAHVMLWTFITGFCVAFTFIAAYIESEKNNVISKECPRQCIPAPFKLWPSDWPLTDLSYCQKNKMQMCPMGCQDVVDQYECARAHLMFLDIVRYLLIVIIPIYVVLMIASFHKILRMIQVMDNMIKPLRQLPKMLIIPFVVSLIQAALGLGFMLIFIIGVTSGQPKTVSAGRTLLKIIKVADFPNPNYRSIEFPIFYNRGFYVVTFLYLWTLQALYYFVRFFIACSSSVWYYSRDKNYLNSPILRPLWYGLKYHIGSFLFGSLLLTATWIFSAIFYFWKLGLQAFDRKSFLLQLLLCWSIPFFWIYEYFSKYISNRNFLHMAIFGDNFWASGQKTFYLRIRNYSRVDMVKSTLGFVRIIGMAFISSLGALIVYWILYSNQINVNIFRTQDLVIKNPNQPNPEVEYPIVPTIFVFFTGLFLAQNLTSIIDIVAEVMVFDMVADEEMFMGQQRFADQDMLDFANKFSKEKAKNDFVVTNKGKINPMNDNADANDVIKPMDLKDLYGANSDDDKDKNGDDDDDNDNDKNKNKNLFPGDDEEYDPNQFKNGLDMDDLDKVGGNEEDVDYVDELDAYNKQRVQDQDKRQKLKSDDIQLDANKVKQDKKQKKLNAQRF